MNSGSEGDLQSFFNDGVGQVARLGGMWAGCAYFRERGMLGSYRFKLDSVELELWNDIVNLKCEDEARELGLALVGALKVGGRGVLYDVLRRKEAFLRKIQDEAGKGAKYVDKSEDYL